MTLLSEKGTKRFSSCCGLLLEDFMVIARSFDKSQKKKLMRFCYKIGTSHVVLSCHINIYTEFENR